MAKVIIETTDSRLLSRFPVFKLTVLGATSGVLWLFLTGFLSSLLTDRLFCSGADLATCSSSEVIAGNIALILVSILAAVVMIRMQMVRVAVLAAFVLATFWGFAGLTSHLGWLEQAAFSVLVFGTAVVAFSYIFRIRNWWVALVLAAAVALAVRWFAFL